jgi:hypothetical protein
MRALVLALAVLMPSIALGSPLTSTITRVDVEQNVVIAAVTAGKTPLARYHAAAPGPYAPGTPLVLIIRVPLAGSADVVTVTDAHRNGANVPVAIETRRYEGPLHANPATMTLVEVALGALPKGTYTIDVAERVLHFERYGAPQAATDPQPGLTSSITLEVQ